MNSVLFITAVLLAHYKCKYTTSMFTCIYGDLTRQCVLDRFRDESVRPIHTLEKVTKLHPFFNMSQITCHELLHAPSVREGSSSGAPPSGHWQLTSGHGSHRSQGRRARSVRGRVSVGTAARPPRPAPRGYHRFNGRRRSARLLQPVTADRPYRPCARN